MFLFCWLYKPTETTPGIFFTLKNNCTDFLNKYPDKWNIFIKWELYWKHRGMKDHINNYTDCKLVS